MTSQFHPDHPLRRLFTGVVEQVFHAEIGICDPRLTDYLSAMLVEFIHMDRIYRLRRVDGDVIRDISRMQADAALGEDMNPTERTCIINRYIGDFTLFWTGVYPETLRPRLSHGADRLREYLIQGKRSYEIASELTPAGREPPADLLANLSDQFEYCVHGLQLARAAWENTGRADFAAPADEN